MSKAYKYLSLSLMIMASPAFSVISPRLANLSASVTLQHRLTLSFPDGTTLPPLVLNTETTTSHKMAASIPYCISTNTMNSKPYTISVSGTLKGSAQTQSAILPYQLKIIDGSGIENNYNVHDHTVIEGKTNFAASMTDCKSVSGPNIKGHIVLEVSQDDLHSALADTYSGQIHLLIQEV